MTDWTIHQGDALEVLRGMPAESVQCCVTSPPYWGLRDYGTATWTGGDSTCNHAKPDRQGQSRERANRTTGHDDYYRDVCDKCGAKRTDSQLGLEATPEEYVARMVEVFRGVRRVLRDDGTLWLVLGDSFARDAAKGQHQPGDSGKQAYIYDHGGGRASAGIALTASGLKPKDLIGIPWMVAKSLQAPYYTGQIRDERNRIWLSAMVEAEGCLFIHKRKAGTDSGAKFTKKDGTEVSYLRKQDTYGSGLEVSSTDRTIIDRCMQIAGVGSICEQSPEQNHRRKQTIYRWNVRSNECKWIIAELYPHFVAKHHEARLLISCPSSGRDAARAHESLKALHNGRQATIDFPDPPSLFEPGWYLRSDIIWAKKNCMPESVRDRPTKSHEYVFLLSKSARYLWDQEAVREPHSEGSLARAKRNRFGGKYQGSDPAEHGRLKAGENYGPNGDPDKVCSPGGRNIRSVWNIATQPFPGAHFAVFPTKLVEPCVKAGTSERGCCAECGAAWVRVVERDFRPQVDVSEIRGIRGADGQKPMDASNTWEGFPRGTTVTHTRGWQPACDCPGLDGDHPGSDCADADNWPTVPCTVLDPFAGSGTTGIVAAQLGRHFIGIELNPEYAAMARDRIGAAYAGLTVEELRQGQGTLFA